MKKRIIQLFFCIVLIFVGAVSAFAQNEGYEKYGRIATAIVNEDYKGEQVVEYEYLGRTKKSADIVTDLFRFEVVENGKTLFVKVNISHHLKDDKTLDITIEKENN